MPTKYFERIKEGLRYAKWSKVMINYKLSNEVLEISSFKVNTSFLLVKNTCSRTILGLWY